MELEWMILLGVTFTGVAWIGTIFRIAVHKRLDLVDWFVGTMGAFNGIGYAIVVWSAQSGINPDYSDWILPYDTYYWLPPTLSLIAISSAWIGSALAGGSRKPFRVHVDLTPEALARIERLAWGLLFAGIFCYYQFAKPYGGFAGLLDYSVLIRSGRIDEIGIDNPFAILSRLGGLAIFSSFLFYAVMIEGRLKSHQYLWLLGLVGSVCFSSYVLYSWLGRVNIVIYFSVFLLAYIYHRSLHSYQVVIRLSLLVLGIAIALPLLSLLMTPGKSSTNFVEFYARELSFPAVSLFSASYNNHFRFFIDFIVTPLYMLPESVWRGVFGVVTASDINTEMILGFQKGEGGVTGEMPTDMITFGYMQMGVIGVAIIGTLVGAGLVRLERLILAMPGRGLRSVLYAYCALMLSSLIVLYADPQNIISRNIHFIIGTVALFISIHWDGVRKAFTQRSIENKAGMGKQDG